jgi:hypothetical protein
MEKVMIDRTKTEAERNAEARIATEWMAGPYGLPKFPVEKK